MTPHAGFILYFYNLVPPTLRISAHSGIPLAKRLTVFELYQKVKHKIDIMVGPKVMFISNNSDQQDKSIEH